MQLGASRYRWTILAAGVFAQGALSALQQGLPALGPELRDQGLTLAQVGVVLACVSWGITVFLLGWGWLADRVGERWVVVAGLTGGAAALTAAAYTHGFGPLVLALTAAGALAGCTSIAGGRAVMGWFGRHQRGLALGVRQMAVPLGGAAGALTLPALAAAGGLKEALLALAGAFAGGALACGLAFRDSPVPPDTTESEPPAPLRDARMWRLSIASGLYVVAQVSVISFTVLFLHEHRHVATGSAAAALGAMQLGGAASRALAGWRSDRGGLRIPLMRRIGLVTALALLATGLLADAPLAVLVPVLLAGGVVGMSWNGLSVTAAAELAGPGRTGAALGLQQTLVALAAGTGVGFAALVTATSWPVAFVALALPPLGGWWLLRPLAGEEARRMTAVMPA